MPFKSQHTEEAYAAAEYIICSTQTHSAYTHSLENLGLEARGCFDQASSFDTLDYKAHFSVLVSIHWIWA